LTGTMQVFEIASGRDTTASRQAYRALRLAIQRGDLALGELYSIGQIAEHLNISRTPVREAVCQLEAESLVEILPQRGFRLRAVSAAEIEEFLALREMLESYVVRTLIARNDPSLVRPLTVMIDRQEEYIDDDEEFIYLAEELHLTMAECAGLPRVAWILNSLRGQLWLLGRQSILQPNRRLAAIAEHRAIVDLIAQGDESGAAAAMRQHLTNTALTYREQGTRADLLRYAADGAANSDGDGRH
jgi:DNA-binding GntR family transcriptional regulator